MIHVGKKQILNVAKEDKSGFYLWDADKNEVFMPGSLVFQKIRTGDDVEVFVYLDGEGNALATPNLPKFEVGDFACLEVKDVTPHGAFLDMGIPKDLLVPRKLQKYEMKVGEVHLVMILLEEGTDRIFGTSKIAPYVETKTIPLRPRQPISVIPYHKTPLGFKVLIERRYMGMVYHNETYTNVVIGQEYQGTVKTIRDDGQVDALLQEIGAKGLESECAKLLSALESAGGRLNISDKSPPELVETKLQMSKKAFKRAVGQLYKQKTIVLGEGYIALNPTDTLKK